MIESDAVGFYAFDNLPDNISPALLCGKRDNLPVILNPDGINSCNNFYNSLAVRFRYKIIAIIVRLYILKIMKLCFAKNSAT